MLAGFCDAKKGNNHYHEELAEGNESIFIEHDNREYLDYMAQRFGGKVYGPYTDFNYSPYYKVAYCWKVTGFEALNFIKRVSEIRLQWETQQ